METNFKMLPSDSTSLDFQNLCTNCQQLRGIDTFARETILSKTLNSLANRTLQWKERISFPFHFTAQVFSKGLGYTEIYTGIVSLYRKRKENLSSRSIPSGTSCYSCNRRQEDSKTFQLDNLNIFFFK